MQTGGTFLHFELKEVGKAPRQDEDKFIDLNFQLYKIKPTEQNG